MPGKVRSFFARQLLVREAWLRALPAIVAPGRLPGGFLVAQPNPHSFGPAWTMLVPLLAVPFDTVVRRIRPPRS
jgi:hypothetical protein